ncbi:MAG: DinB family protein [Planctomycetes bacterium]|jgi:hypothetical protein|nr:DinB family protein [Planctomycetota bacterium]
MHPRTQELLSVLEQSHAELRAAFDAVPEAQREQPQAADRWSAAQVIEHLAHTATGIATLLSRGLRKLERDGLRPATDEAPVLPTIDAARLLDRAQRVQAPATVQPKHGLTAQQAWQALDDSRRMLIEALRAGDGIDTSSIKAPHPALGELDFHQWIAFVGLHERRHAAQLREVAVPA